MTGQIRIVLNHEDREGYMLIPEGTKPAVIGAALAGVEALGWEELALDETGDEPEILEDGTMKVLFVRS